MGTPIMACQFLRAITDQQVFDDLVRDMAFNATNKYYNVNACNHTPECRKLTPEEDRDIKRRLLDAIKKEHSDPNARWIY